MRILVIAPRWPYPVVGGDKLRLYQLCVELSRVHDMTLLSLCDSRAELEQTPPEDGVFSSIERVLVPRWRSVANVVAELFRGGPLQLAYYRSEAVVEAVRRLAPSHDVVLGHLIRVAPYVELSSLPSVLEMTDAMALTYSRLRRENARISLKQLAYRVEEARVLRFERALPERFDVVSLVSEVDRTFLWGTDIANVVVAGNGVDVAQYPFELPMSSSRELVFIGNMRSLQNQDACEYFASEVLPELRQRFGVSLRVVGAAPPEVEKRLGRYPGVRLTGAVSAVAAHCRGAFAGICPVRVGAGVQNKVLEYMALGLPVVSSSVGVEGIPAIVNEHYLRADSTSEWVESVGRLLNDHASAERMAVRARTLVQTKCSWSNALAPLVSAVSNLGANDSGEAVEASDAYRAD